MAVQRSDDEIQEQFEVASVQAVERSQYPAMTYEQGVRDALAWVVGESDDAPMETV